MSLFGSIGKLVKKVATGGLAKGLSPTGQAYAATIGKPGSAPDAPLNPNKDYFGGGDLVNLQQVNPAYYDYLMNGDAFDYTKAPTGSQFIDLPGKHHDLNVDWNALTAPFKKAATDKAAQDKAVSDAAAADAATKAAAATKRTGDITKAKGYAQQEANDIISSYGLDPTSYADKIAAGIGRETDSLGDTGDPYTQINGQFINNQLQQEQSQKRAQFGQQAASEFGPTYSSTKLQPSLLDNTISQILGEQQGSAQQYLDRGKARGIYNDVGYGAGASQLGSQAEAGRAQLSTLGNDVLSGYKTKLDDVRDKAYSAASGYTLGQPLNLDAYAQEGNQIANDAQTNAGGQLRSALGGQNFFDFSKLTNAAGSAQGAQNLQDTDLMSALAQRKKANAVGRGLGSQGAF